MTEFSRPRPVGYSSAVTHASSDKLVFLRKVYGLFTASMVSAAAGATIALYAGADLSNTGVSRGDGLRVPPLVAFFGQHYIIAMLLFFGAFSGASAVRLRPGLNLFALFGAAFVSGLYIAPMLWIAQAMASQGGTLSASPVRDAFLLATTAFGGLTTYALLSKKDFSFMGGFLSMGLWVLIGASLLGLFVGGQAFSLAIASVAVLLFGGYILYDTSRMVHNNDHLDPVGAALGLYLNFLNLFIALLRILMSGSRRDG